MAPPRLAVQRASGAWWGGEIVSADHFEPMTARVSSPAIAKRLLKARLAALGVDCKIEVIR